MKIKPFGFLALALFSTFNHQFSAALAQGTAFTYQGRLTDNSSPANGIYDLRFIMYNADSGGSQQGPILTNASTVITGGVFTVTLDFGSVFLGADRWLEIGVRTNGISAFSTLSPRQKITPTPYAITAENVDGFVPAGQLTGTLPGGLFSGTYGNAVNLNNAGNIFSGTFSGNGSGLTGLNADSATSAASILAAEAKLTIASTGTFGSGAGFLFDGGNNGLLLETSAFGESAGLFLNGNTAVLYSPGDSDILRVYDEDLLSLVNPIPAFTVLNANLGIRTSGRVGIGINTDPGFPLSFADVLGDKISLWGQSGNSYGFGIQGSLLQIHSDSSGSDVAFGFGSSSAFTETMRIKGNGKVGIGVNDPTAGLQVTIGPDVTTGGMITAGPHTGSRIAIDGDDIQRYNGGTAATLFLNYYGGNVDIGSFGATTTIKGTFVNSSDRNIKEDFAPVNAQAVLNQLQTLPLSTWKFKGAEARRHIGPMAQDFHAAFDRLLDLKSDDKTLSPLDEAGVAFAAIQALQAQVAARDEKISAMEKRLAALEARDQAREARLARLGGADGQ